MLGKSPDSLSFCFTALVSLSSLCTSLAAPTSPLKHRSGIPYSSNAISLRRVASRADSQGLSKRWYGEDVPLSGPKGGSIVVGDIRIGTQTFTVRFDTGSSDVWVPSKNFTCPDAVPGVLYNNNSTPESILASTLLSCVTKHEGYDAEINPSFSLLDFENNFNLSYAAGAANGIGAKDDVSVGSITVPNMTFGLVKEAASIFTYGGTSDGVFGLAGSTLTSIYNGTDPTKDVVDPKYIHYYTPWFDRAWQDGLVDPYVTFWLKRPTDEETSEGLNITDFGVMTLGGIPEDAPYSDTTVTVPNLEFPNVGQAGTPYNITWWTAAIEEFKFPGSDKIPKENNSAPLAIFDSGQSVISIPPLSYQAFIESIEPKPIVNETTGLFYPKCDAQVPDLGVVIGGVEFTIPAKDLVTKRLDIISATGELPKGYCACNLGPSVTRDDRLYMGDPFFWSHIITKDYENKELTFTQIPTDYDNDGQ